MQKEFEKRLFSSIILIPIAFFFVIKGSFFFIFFLSVSFLITSYEWTMMSKKKNYLIPGLIFLIFSFYTVFELRNNFDYYNLFIFLFILIICIATDLGGYIFGKIFKGPKLTSISPNKTYAGFFGSFFLSIITINLYLNYSNSLNLDIPPFAIGYTKELFIFTLSISLVSQIGDLIISYFKRLSKLKDTGKILPGHGGLLDRIDGMIFAFPFSYLILNTNIF